MDDGSIRGDDGHIRPEYRNSLLPGKPFDIDPGRLVRTATFVDLGHNHREIEIETIEELRPPWRRRSQHEPQISLPRRRT
jgi:hypothetical protein